MGREGIVLLPNNGRDSLLRITAAAPVAKAVLRLELNKETLDQFLLAGGNFEKVYQVPVSRQAANASSELRLVTTEVMKTAEDPRQLGLRIFEISWSGD
jgi:hypothetical protein